MKRLFIRDIGLFIQLFTHLFEVNFTSLLTFIADYVNGRFDFDFCNEI